MVAEHKVGDLVCLEADVRRGMLDPIVVDKVRENEKNSGSFDFLVDGEWRHSEDIRKEYDAMMSVIGFKQRLIAEKKREKERCLTRTHLIEGEIAIIADEVMRIININSPNYTRTIGINYPV